MAEDVDPDATVVRFRPTAPESVLKWAEKAHRDSGYFRLSVWLDVKRDGESDDALRVRLVRTAGMNGIDLSSNPKFYVCTQASELLKAGFTFYKDRYEGEPEEHYSVDLGPSPTVEDVERFLTPFRITERKPQ